jgi:hypothetical protein
MKLRLVEIPNVARGTPAGHRMREKATQNKEYVRICDFGFLPGDQGKKM